MELGGNEKRIQALFSELSLEDQMSVPQFGHIWSRAQVVEEIKGRSPSRPVAVLISILVTAVACSFAVWAWSASQPPDIAKVMVVETPYTPVKLATVSQPEKVQPRRQRNSARRSETDRKLATKAALLSTWQSPTQAFMESPSGISLSSLPQLNQSVKDLESFLPKNTEIMKESNQ